MAVVLTVAVEPSSCSDIQDDADEVCDSGKLPELLIGLPADPGAQVVIKALAEYL